MLIFVVGIVGGTCDHCDIKEISLISNKLLDALCQASLHEYPGIDCPPDPYINRLKDDLMDMIGFGSISPTSSSPSLGIHSHTNHSASVTLKEILGRLDRFQSYVIERKSFWSTAASLFSSDYSPDQFPVRAAHLSSGVFPPSERELMASSLIRRYDEQFEYHCSVSHCGEKCKYSLHACQNEGCNARYTLRDQKEHEEICQFQLIACQRECEEMIKRKDMQVWTE